MDAAQPAGRAVTDDPAPDDRTAGRPVAAAVEPESGPSAEAGGARVGAGASGGAPAGSGGSPKIRSGRSARDMATSLLVLLIPIAVLLGFYRVLLDGDEPVRVDPAPVVADARAAGAFPVSEPAGLAEGWLTVSARFQRAAGASAGGARTGASRAADGAILRLGLISPDGNGVQVVQSDLPVEELLPAELTGDGRPQGTVRLAGRSWQWYSARPGERALVLLEPARTVIVVGAARDSELTDLAAALR